MKKVAFRQIALISLIVLPLVFAGLVAAQPAPIGDVSYTQKESFDSNPTTGSVSGLGTPTGTINNVFDGDLGSNINFNYGVSASGSTEVTGFKKPSDSGLTDFAITFIDLKVDYRAQATASSNDTYRIVAYVDPSPTAIVLQDWVWGNNPLNHNAIYPPGINANPAVRTFSNVTEPNDGVWDWTDLAGLRVRFETQVVNNNDFQRVYEHEVWVTAYSTPYPSAGTMSVQTPIIGGLTAGNLFYVDIYVVNVVKMWGYQFVLNFDPAILTPLEFMSYGPFISALPSEIGSNYFAVAYKTYDGDPVGFNGSTPIARLYFAVAADGSSLLSFSQSYGADIYGNSLVFTPRSGVFATSLVRDLAVTTVNVNSTSVLPGNFTAINATVVNQGSVTETFNVTAFYDSTPIETETVANLTAGAVEDLTFMWNTTGVTVGLYQIKVAADIVIGESDTQNNVKVFGNVIIGRHDIVVKDIVRTYSNGTVVSPGVLLNVTRPDIVNINVTVQNSGTFSEVFNFTLVWEPFGQTLGIENRTNVALDAGVSRNLTFVWNTTETNPRWRFSLDRWGRPNNFTRGSIRAVATPDWSTGVLKAVGVPYEKGIDYDYVVNNDLIDSEVRVNRDFRYPYAKFNVSPLTAKVTQPVEFNGGPPYSFPGTSLDFSHNFTMVEYRWDFGDNNITSGNYPIIHHAYSSVGNYTVKLTVVNNLTLSDTVQTFEVGAPNNKVQVTLRNIKVVSVGFSPTTGVVGQNVTISVTVKNMGVDDENLVANNIYVYFFRDNDVFFGRVRAPDLGALGSPGGTDTRTVAFNWTVSGLGPGVHTIKAVLNSSNYESDYADNTFIASLSFLWHNVKVTGITFSKTEATVGDSVTVSVTVLNQGNFTQTFTVTAYVNDTAIGSAQTVTDLAAGASKVVEFAWDTGGLNSGVYVFRAVASNVTLEAVTSDNAFAGGSVTLSSPSNMLTYIIIGAAAVIVIVALVGVYFLKFRKPK